MTYQEQRSEHAARELHAAVDSLSEVLSRVRRENPDIRKIGVNVTAEDGDSTTSARRLIITIEADTLEHAQLHALQLSDQGCNCVSTGETSFECDCSDVPD